MNKWYGEQNVAIIKIDGKLAPNVARAFNVPYYPYFIHMKPSTENPEGEHSHFQGSERNYEGLKEWMVESMGTVKPLPG